MAYTFEPGKMYRMPTHFGPSLGPRQGPAGRKFTSPESHRARAWSVQFLSNPAQLDALLPPGFALAGEPLVSVTFTEYKNIEWLAGRGYNTLGVSFPARFDGERDHAAGEFLTVLWENLADPIITGREELGFSKIYCELPEPITHAGRTHCIASWLGFTFMDMYLSDMAPAEVPAAAAAPDDGVLRGALHYKYMPRTGDWGAADAAYPVLTPAETPNRVVHEVWRGAGAVHFHPAAWEDLPTQYTVVNAFASLEVREYRGASITHSAGHKDLSDQRILR
jgi:hypothetical protein